MPTILHPDGPQPRLPMYKVRAFVRVEIPPTSDRSMTGRSLGTYVWLIRLGITVGGYTLGCFFGAVATIWLGNLLGRRKTIFVGSSIMVVGAAIQCSSFSLGQLIAARLITGFGNGMVRFGSLELCLFDDLPPFRIPQPYRLGSLKPRNRTAVGKWL